ncbi:hypothetical protein WR25_06957 isoform B [Diploscapter pachys]|uniref:STAS domain-containing protein n=1 Tax=Diploscapter pachys TaxID=2018661 RepID=A0A2A2KY10_9BILA|nr:hypothetical protein WR25_06957 isoform B [Diploscapter pachys]
MNQIEYDVENQFNPHEEIPLSKIVIDRTKDAARECCTLPGVWKSIQKRVPALRWLPKYKLKTNLLPDALAGATLGIYNIPQGMSYSVLASLPPVYGLYTSFFPPLIYFLFGSSRHTSIGVFSLTCIMIAKARTDIIPDFKNGTTATDYKDLHDLTPISVITALGLLTGLIQIAMALVRLDFLTSYLSDSAISGLTFGAAIQAVIAQLNGVLGTKSDKINHTFLQNFYLIVGTLLSHFCQFEKRWGVHVISDIPVGMPVPEIPRFDVMRYLIGEAFSIAIVAFTVTVSMGKLFAKKHSYRIDPNQELLALGLCNSISSFFDVFPTSTSLSRTLVNEASGAKTQISGLVSSLIILLVILLIGPSLEDLPMCILSCIVLVALRSLLMKITELPKLWRCSKLDVIIWVVTALVTILWDIMQGLLAGIIVALVLVVARTQWPRLHELGVVDELYSDFRDMNRYEKASPTRVPIVRFDAPLIFTNVDVFKKRMRQVVDRMDVKRESKDSWRELTKMQSWAPLILDCSTWIYTDSMGVEAIKDVNRHLNAKCKIKALLSENYKIKFEFSQTNKLNSAQRRVSQVPSDTSFREFTKLRQSSILPSRSICIDV